MNKYLVFIFLFFIFCVDVFAESSSTFGDNAEVFNNGFEEQKQVSNSEFEKTIKEMKERSLTQKQKKARKEIQPNSPYFDSEHLKNFANSQDPDNGLSQTLTVMIPLRAYSEYGKYIEPGYYKLSCRKVGDNSYVLDLSQGAKRIISIEANQTEQDLEQDTIQFCNAQVISNGRIRLMYGTIELNLVGYLYY